MQELNEKIYSLFEDQAILDNAKDCKDIHALFEVCRDRLPEVSETEFTEAVQAMQENSTILDEKDLECVAGGGVTLNSINISKKDKLAQE